MTEPQFQFAATHFAGTQKVTRDARHLRQYNPGFVLAPHSSAVLLNSRP